MSRLRLLQPLLLIALAAFFWEFGFGVYRTVFQNFFNHELGMGGGALGLLEGIREIPGLLTMVLAALTLSINPPVLGGLSILLLAVGLGFFAVTSSFAGLVVVTLIFSTGFHLLFPVQNALVLRWSRPEERGLRLGQIEGVASAAQLVAMGTVFASAAWLSLRSYFVVGAVVSALGALAMFALPREDRPAARPDLRSRFLIRRRYRTYYWLTLLNGARRHMFLTFAAFNLISVYGVGVQTVALLLAISHVLSILGRPLMGLAVDRLGERPVFIACYAVVGTLLVGYATITSLPVLYALFCLDNLFRFEMVVTAYLGRTADPEDVPQTLATGSTINHIAGVAVPIIGGMLWEGIGPHATFTAGAVVAAIGLLYSLLMPASEAAPAAPGVPAGRRQSTPAP